MVRPQADVRGGLADKLTIEEAADRTRILPAYLSDNYLSLFPGESREIDIEYPAEEVTAKIAFRRWNLSPFSVSAAQQ